MRSCTLLMDDDKLLQPQTPPQVIARSARSQRSGDIALRIRYVSGDIPWPLDSGVHQRQYYVLKALGEYGRVDLVALSRVHREIPDEIASLCGKVSILRRPPIDHGNHRGRLSRCGQLVRELRGNPFPAPGKSLLAGEEGLGSSDNYDVTWVARLNVAMAATLRGGADIILDLDDIEHLKISRSIRSSAGGTWSRLRKRIEARAWRIQERSAVGRFARIIVCSEEDREQLGKRNVTVIPNGVTIDPDVRFNPGLPGRMLYVGAMSYAPNDDAVRYFIKHVLPTIRQHHPAAHLVVVGGNPSPALRSAAAGESVELVGRVEDVRPYYEEASISVVPLRVGGGTRIKILESLSLKTPVVSTAIGAEGLDLTDGTQIVIADDPGDFATACGRLLEDREKKSLLAEAGFQRVTEQYDWNTIERTVGAVLQEVASLSSSRSPRM